MCIFPHFTYLRKNFAKDVCAMRASTFVYTIPMCIYTSHVYTYTYMCVYITFEKRCFVSQEQKRETSREFCTLQIKIVNRNKKKMKYKFENSSSHM